MSKINSKHTTSKCIVVQFICAALIILSYYTTPYLNIAAGLIGLFYILSNIRWEERFSLLFFILPLSNVFKLGVGQTSLFMFLRIAIVLSVLIYDYKKFNNPSLYLMFLFMLFYVVCVSWGNDVYFITIALNLMLWVLIVYCMQAEITSENMLHISRGLVNGTIISCVVAMNLDSIPNMREIVSDNSLFIAPQVIESRFSGLLNDPNIFAVLICMCLWVCYMEFSKGNIKSWEFTVRTIIISFFGAITYSKSCLLIIVLFWCYILVSQNSIKISTRISIGIAFSLALIYFFGVNTSWIDIIRSRFGSGTRDLDTLTTGRVTIWSAYLEYLYVSSSWVWGNGLNALLPLGKAAHNTILECIYSLGIVGTFIMYRLIKLTYNKVPNGLRSDGVDRSGVMFLLFVCVTMMFLDGLYQEIYYYALPLCFIYMKKLEPIVMDVTDSTENMENII